MNYSIIPFPTLTHELTLRIGYSAEEFTCYYIEDGDRKHLNIDTDDSNGISLPTLKISDDENQWHPDTHNFNLERTITIRNPGFLFGDNGVVPDDSELGVALLWFSRDSNQRGVFDSQLLPNTNLPTELKFRAEVLPGMLKGTVSLQLILFLKKSSFQTDSLYATKEGTTLGILDESKLILDGRGSVFPIVEVEEPSRPLWFVEWGQGVDPLEDLFTEDNVSLCINISHQDYPLLNMKQGVKNSPFLQEIISSAMQIIVMKALEGESRDLITQGKDMEPGSIAQAVYYFISTFGWDTSSPERLALTIRRDLESRM